MSLLRTFIAIDIPAPILQNIRHNLENLKKAVGDTVRWVAVANIHLTLKFLGGTSPNHLKPLTQMLQEQVESCPALEIHMGGLGSFPNSKRPRVLVIGIQAPTDLEALQSRIEAAAVRLGYESDSRPFSPHLTIGRVNQGAPSSELQRLSKFIHETKIDSLGTARVDSIHLYKSELNPGGSVYTKLFSAALQITRGET